jgi:ribosomal protein L37AE/L43A
MGRDAVVSARLLPARFRKKCPLCGEPIEAGDMIGLIGGLWSCEQCVQDGADGEEESSS